MNSLDSANLFEYPEFNIANGPSVQQKDQFSLLDSVSEKASSKFAKNGANSSVRKRGRDVDALDITPDRLSEKRTKNDGDVRQIEAKAAPPKSVIGNSKTTKGKKPPFANNNVSAIDAARNSQQSWNSTSTESLSSYTAINDVEWDSTSIDAERLPNSEFPQDIIGDTGNHLEHTRSTTNNKATTANSHSLNSTLKSSGGNSRSLYPPSLSQANGSSMPKSHGPSNTENRHHHQHHHHQSYLASTTSTGSGANGKPRHLLHHRTSLSDIKKRVAQLATYVRTFEHEILISRPVSITKDSTKTLLPQCVCANRNTIITKKSVKGLFNSNDNSSSSSSSRSSSSTSSSSKKIDFTNENGEITEGSRHELEPSDYNTTVAISSNVDTAVAYIAQSAPPLIAAPILTPPLSTASPSPIFGSLARLSSADSGGVLRDTQSTSSVELNSQIACLEICSICEGQISNNFNGSNLGEKAKADDGGLVEDKINSAAVLKRLMWRLDEFGKTFGSC
ncbi:hypothetical protein HK100_003092 [Physocladia obscura]|uniref:Uncharacterized protein n=1 Tax=Physocladia obscura TaxID=109957 RepID=A0AAD5T9E0_9FUNG|nr:hypothetical protein HK100_003092 [Physocladia obscura]